MNKLDQAIINIANQEVPEERLEQAADRVRSTLFAKEDHTAPERLRSCADFQAIIPAYLARTLSAGRALLLQDHTRECVACRHALNQARSGAKPALVRPVTPPSRVLPNIWAIAAMAVLSLGLGTWIVSRVISPGGSGQIAVNTVNGILYAVSDRASTPIFAGKAIAEGQRVRTAKESTAVVRLPDGSLVEMNERSELSVSRSGGSTTIRLDRGNIIVQAAKQRTGTLNVLTPDCEVSVKGTVFAVDRGTKGSRVTVIEGAVKVAQGAQSQMLRPGDQVSTDASLAKTPAADILSWSRDSAKFLALLGEFSIIKKGLEQMPAAGLRHDSKLLPLISRNAVLYAAIPNAGPAIAEAQRLFNERLQQSEVLRAWWQEQQDNKKLEEMIQKLRTFSDYLGDEIVFTVDGDWEGNYSQPMILAEVKRTGLDAFLNNELRQLSLHGAKDVPEVVQLRPREDGQANRYYRKSLQSGSTLEKSRMLIGIKDGLMAVSWSQEQLDSLAGRVADPPANDDPGRLVSNVKAAYDRGINWLLCVNMEHIARNSVHKGKGRNNEDSKLPPGLEAMRYLIVERKDIAGKTENQATLTFEGRRAGVAAWLAEPSPMGSLDFVSPNATFVVSAALRSPQWMMSDLFRTMSQRDPKFEERLDQMRRESGLQISPALGEPMGGEMTFAIDGPLLPLPSWKLAIEVYSPDRMQWAIEQFVQAFNKKVDCPECQVRLTSEQAGNRTYYTLSSDRFSYEIDYVFVDGYLLAAPSRTLLNTAIQNRETGYVLSRSEAFRAQLPRDGRMNFSAIVYHNIGSALAPFANQLGSVAGANQEQRKSIQALAANSTPGLIYAYGEPDRITVASSGTFFGLDLNSFAIPTLIGKGMPNAASKRIQ